MKKIIYYHEHIKLCKAKYELNVKKQINVFKSCESNNHNEINTFKDLKKAENSFRNINNDITLIVNDKISTNFILFKYFNDHPIDKGGNMQVF